MEIIVGRPENLGYYTLDCIRGGGLYKHFFPNPKPFLSSTFFMQWVLFGNIINEINEIRIIMRLNRRRGDG